MFTRALKMAFWVAYDHLGGLLAANLVSFAMVFGPFAAVMAAGRAMDNRMFFAALILSALFGLHAAAVAMAGLAAMVRELIETRDGSVGRFFSGMRRFAFRAAVLAAMYGIVSTFLLTSLWFYGVRLSASFPLAGYGLGVLAFWVQLFVLLTVPAAFPALVNRDAGPVQALKLAVFLVLDNPLYYAGVSLHLLVLAVFCLMAPPLLVCFSFAPAAVFAGAAYEMQSRKYAVIRAAGGAGASAKGLKIEFNDANDDYLNRGFQDLVFPWKS